MMADSVMEGNAGDAIAAFPVPNERGGFADEAGETIWGPVLQGVDALVRVVQQADGWRAGYSVQLPDGSGGTAPQVAQAPMATRTGAVIAAAEEMVAWLSGEKEKGSKRHQKAAAKAQAWALELARQTAQEAEGAAGRDADAATGAADDAIPAAAVEAMRATLASDMAPRLFPVERLRESPLNPRRHIPEVGIDEMAERIRHSGFQPWTPIVARPCEDGYAEIAAGHRRRLGAIRAGLAEVPCVIRPMTDEEFLDILNFDNSGREDVHPLHEAAGWRTWMERTGKGVLDIAARIGKSKEYVYQRLRYASLIPDAQDAFLGGAISSAHAIRIARLTARDQVLALRACEAPQWDPEDKPSERDLGDWIKRNLHLRLTDALFPLGDEVLVPAAGSCTACPHRLGNAVDFNPAEDLADSCMRRECYEEKVQAFIAVERLRGETLLVKVEAGPADSNELVRGRWRHARRDEPGARQALVVDGDAPGTQIWVTVIDPTRQVTQSAATSEAPTSKRKPAGLSKEERERERKARAEEAARARKEAARQQREREERELKLAAEGAARLAILKAVLGNVHWPPRREEVAELLRDVVPELDSEVAELVEDQGVSAGHRFEDFRRASDDELARLVVISVVSTELAEWACGRGMDKLAATAKRYGVDVAQARRIAEAQHTIETCGIDFGADRIECKAGKEELAYVEFQRARGGLEVRVGAGLPMEKGNPYGEYGPLRRDQVWSDKGAAIDAAFTWLSKYTDKALKHSGANAGTEEAAVVLREWIQKGRAARAAMVMLSDLPKGAERAPAKKGAASKAPAKKAGAKKGGKK